MIFTIMRNLSKNIVPWLMQNIAISTLENENIISDETRPFGPRRKAWSAGPRRDIVVA